uniref:Eukaryotic peptide chain release factor subunit 1 n=1 Tax=Corethron hystrix TaxID=216773 RepID=A0A7S1B6T2_9STRA|mmetsp:Transcript_14836/g.32894  ORF Transcript_14836/g.32894 Transcript_14836/m.32894 type:complete len:458 (+) Transcript_14836:347-1720(+)|eukprot:CAMPEP_0113307448 /NCGR_PEP_ID=MMETSP0010_2-20120614/6288_1 /TAXON_ID=216773 ORGANISM="Corethron hystrix, Strain 308" /NCGR_SAMPLE_ID=MMETSP0010_2 /ASSEMBLY_ACC=CAM_ASM_000155 /LENGTH=457 /DNA_ID=CAMNT_0000162303 /DNA_START=202 /DNA_END=1575 /DNA_ORIENTATION=- /assembly_acc=CAM_ASM_000155
MSDKAQDDIDKQIEMFKVKKLIKNLQAARGNGTSMISLIIPPGDQISRVNKMLSDEYGTASNIKSRVNRLSVLGAITSTQQRLKLYSKCPKHGLVIYCGTVVTDDGKERRVNIDFEPFKPINTSLYLCDNKFHTEDLNELLIDDEAFGFIVMDGNGCLYGTVQGSNREVLHKFSVDLPKKHGRGGQSALRFARLRLEKRHNYVRKVAELATQMFIVDGQRPNVQGIVMAGSADFKSELMRSDLFDQRLHRIVIKMVDVSYGGENGFNQAIDLSADTLGSVKLMKEKKMLQGFMDEISRDTGKFCFGVDDTLKALELGAVEDLIIWENLEISRYVLRNTSSGEQHINHINKEQEGNDSMFKDPETGVELEVVEKEPLVDWMANSYKNFGCTLHFITDRSGEGTQFTKGFGGIGGVLRWKVDFVELNNFDNNDTRNFEEESESDDESDGYGFDDGDFGF